MGFYVSIDKEKMGVLRMLQNSPNEVFGKPFGGYILFLAGGADEEVLFWISRNISILDSLTGDDIAFGIIAQSIRCKLSTNHCATRRDSSDGRIIDVPLEELTGARSITSIFKTGRYGWIMDGDEINAITYGTDKTARTFGVMGELPCMIIMDGIPKETFEVFRLDSNSITSLITVLRQSIQLLLRTENYSNYRNTMNNVASLQESKDTIQKKIDNIRSLYGSLVPIRYSEASQQQKTDLLSSLEAADLVKIDSLLVKYSIDPSTHELITARKQLETILTYNQTIHNLYLYINEQKWPLEEPWLSKYCNVYHKWIRFLLNNVPSEPDLDSPAECKLIREQLIRDKGKLIHNTLTLLRAEFERQMQNLVAKRQGIEQEIKEKVAALYHDSQPSFVECFKKQFYRERKKTITQRFANKALAYSGSWLRPESLVEIVKTFFIP